MKLFISDYDGTLKTDEINLRLNVEAIKNFRKMAIILPLQPEEVLTP